MGKAHDNKKTKNKKKKWKVIVGILVIAILLIVAVVISALQKGENGDIEASKLLEIITGDEPNTKEEDSESVAEKEAPKEPQELISAETAQNLVEKTEEGGYVEDDAYISGEIKVNDTAIFFGQYVEDGRDELVENVAAIQVTNNSVRYLELATLLYEIDGQTATFVATGIPPGRTAWVMEKSRMTVTGEVDFNYQGSTTSFRDDVTATSETIQITSDGNMLTAVNNSGKTLENIVVYYKALHVDGNYLGGITYVVDFGEVKTGESSETLAGHYKEGRAEIVRIDWTEK